MREVLFQLAIKRWHRLVYFLLTISKNSSRNKYILVETFFVNDSLGLEINCNAKATIEISEVALISAISFMHSSSLEIRVVSVSTKSIKTFDAYVDYIILHQSRTKYIVGEKGKGVSFKYQNLN